MPLRRSMTGYILSTLARDRDGLNGSAAPGAVREKGKPEKQTRTGWHEGEMRTVVTSMSISGSHSRVWALDRSNYKRRRFTWSGSVEGQ